MGSKGVLGSGFNFNNYSMLLKSELQRYLNKQGDLRHKQYKVEVRIWLAADGSVKRTELLSGTGDDATDEQIKQALLSVPRFSEVPPASMPQPVHLRILSMGRH